MNVRSGVGTSPWIVSDELGPLGAVVAAARTALPLARPQAVAGPGSAVRDLYVLHTGIKWELSLIHI